MDDLTPTTHQAMARFRASLLRRASAVAWVVLIIIAGQAVRNQVFAEVGFWIPMTALAAMLLISAVTRWDRLMATRFAPWVAVAWLTGLIIAITAFALLPNLTATATPILYGIAAVSGLLLTWWAHAFMTVFIAAAISFINFSPVGTATEFQDVLALILTVTVVSAATALVGMEFEREAVRSAARESQIDQQRLDFERLYAVSATLARAESLSEIVPHLVGTICKYLDAQVGLVLLYAAERHRLEVMSPIWVNGHPLDTDPIVLDVSTPGVVSQTYRSGKPMFVREIDQDADAHVLLKDLGLRQALVAPLKVENLRVGAIIVGDPHTGSFNEDQLEQLGSLAAPAGLVLSQ
ncbi:MAG: GAF domain-containing protein, partial [Acidimicrobiia bacterium]